MKTLIIFASFAAVALLVAPAAHAARGNCAAEVKKFCPNTPVGPKRVACLEEHLKELSPACKKAHQKGVEHNKAFREGPKGAAFSLCKDDIAKFCSNIEPGGGRLIKCLKKNEASLSDACKSAQKEISKP